MLNLGNRHSQHSFAQVPDIKVPRSVFDRSFARKDTFDFDYLNPCFWDIVYPGDTVNMNVSHFMRLATPKVPIMDNLWVDFYFFYIPLRLVWSNFQKFMGEQDNPSDSISYVIPSLAAFPAGGPEVGTIYDKYGLPTDVTNSWTCQNALPFRCYNLVWNQWFRDQNLQNSLTVLTGDAADPVATYALVKGGKRHDYFTSCLPWAQKGTAVSLPLGTSATVKTSSTDLVTTGGVNGAPMHLRQWDTNNLPSAARLVGLTTAAGSVIQSTTALTTGTDSGYAPTNLYADLSTATAATINALRLAFQTQAFLERDARGGTRFVELIASHFNINVPDYRVQRPEYIGGGSARINCHPVAQTAPTSGTNAQGQLAAFGTSGGDGTVSFNKSFFEHGIILGLVKARADITYQQGLKREWSYQTRLDLFWPEFQDLGEQTVLNKEIYLNGDANDNLTFGYQERYAEMRYYPSQICGQFRSTYATPLDQWHMAEEFGSLPTLSSTFIQSSTPIDRATALTSTGATLLADFWFNYKHTRQLKTYGVPSSLTRF